MGGGQRQRQSRAINAQTVGDKSLGSGRDTFLAFYGSGSGSGSPPQHHLTATGIKVACIIPGA